MAPKAKKQTPTKVVAPAPTPAPEPTATPVAVEAAKPEKVTTTRRGVKLPTNVSAWCRTMIDSAELESTKKSLLIMGTSEGDLIAVVEEENNTYTPVTLGDEEEQKSWFLS